LSLPPQQSITDLLFIVYSGCAMIAKAVPFAIAGAVRFISALKITMGFMSTAPTVEPHSTMVEFHTNWTAQA
jgi:hypothetical protein